MESRFNSYVIVKRGLSDNQLSEPKVKEIITTNNRTLQMTKVFPETSTIEDVFKSLSPLLQDCTTGISSTIIIYGTSNSGHPWTLHGSPENPGIMNRSINQIFRVLGEDYSVNLSIILIYDEQIFDLQSDEKIKLGIRTKHDGYFVSGLKKVQIFESFQALDLIKQANNRFESFKINTDSLCYNIIYDFDIEERGFNGHGEFMYSKLRFVNIQPNCYKQTFGSGTTYGSMVSTHILFQKLVNNIAENEKFMQFRDSCVTLLLSDSLRCSKVTIITCIASNDSKPEVDNLIFASGACFAKSFLRIGIRKFNFMF